MPLAHTRRDLRLRSPGPWLAPCAAGGALVAAIALLWLRFNVAPGRTGVPFPRDFLYYFVPMTEWVGGRLRAGELPLWNPHSCSGIPLLATLQVAAFYPGTWLTLWLHAADALPLEMLAECLLSGGFAALLFRAWGHGLPACVAGAVLYVFSCVLGSTHWPPALSSLVWLPAILLCLEKLAQGWRWRWWIGLAACLALQLLAGYSQYAVYTWYLALPYALVRLGAEGSGLGGRAVAARLAGVGLAFALGAGLAAVQLLPTAELVGTSHRGQALTAEQIHYGFYSHALSISGMLRNAFDPKPKLTIPGYGFGHGYLGIPTLVLLASGILCGRRSRSWFFGAAALLSLLLSAGFVGPTAGLYELYAQLPTGSTFRDPQRFRVLTFFCVTALAVPGFDALARGFSALRGRRLAAAVAVAGALLCTVLATTIGGPLGFALASATLALAGAALRTGQPAVRRACAGLLLALLVADVIHATRPGAGSFRAVPRAWIESLHDDALELVDGERFAALAAQAGHARLAFPDFDPLLGIGALSDGYRTECLDPLAPAVWSELHAILSGRRDMRYLIARLSPAATATVYDLAGVVAIGTAAGTPPPWALPTNSSRTFRAPGPAPAPGWLELELRRNADALPRAYLVTHYEVLPQAQALGHVARGDFDFRRSVILDRAPPELTPSPEPSPLREVAIVAYAEERVEIEAQADRAALLVLSDTSYPGWAAEVDEQPTEVYRANGLFRAVVLPPGRHRVRFVYRPASLYRGAAACAASLAVLVLLPLLARRRRAASGRRAVPGPP